jgi:hypothetical protein
MDGAIIVDDCITVNDRQPSNAAQESVVDKGIRIIIPRHIRLAKLWSYELFKILQPHKFCYSFDFRLIASGCLPFSAYNALWV